MFPSFVFVQHCVKRKWIQFDEWEVFVCMGLFDRSSFIQSRLIKLNLDVEQWKRFEFRFIGRVFESWSLLLICILFSRSSKRAFVNWWDINSDVKTGFSCSHCSSFTQILHNKLKHRFLILGFVSKILFFFNPNPAFVSYMIEIVLFNCFLFFFFQKYFSYWRKWCRILKLKICRRWKQIPT